MSLWRQIPRGFRVLFNRSAADRDVTDEVSHYLDAAIAAHRHRGLSPDAARRAAALELGNITRVREQVRGYGWENAVGALLADLRLAARRLRHHPGFTVVAVLTLALGIGAATAIFSAVNPILFEALPYPHADRVVQISDVGNGGDAIDVTYGTYLELAARSHSFDALAVADRWRPALLGAADVEPERLQGQRVSAAYFRTLGVLPAVGRAFEESEAVPNTPNVIVISDRMAQRRLGGNIAALGQSILLDGDPYTVIGVMPRTFDNVLAPATEAWAPLRYVRPTGFQGPQWGHHLEMTGRLKTGIGIEDAHREIDAIGRAKLPEYARPPWADMGQGMLVGSLRDAVARGVRLALLAIAGAVVLLLVIASVNVTNLLLARGAQRRGEFAVRTALGAGRRRLIRQLVTESLLLAVVGGALGLGIAQAGVRALVALSPPGLPRLDAMHLDGAVFAFAMLLTTAIGVIVGIVPALHVSRRDLAAGLQQGSRRTAGGHHVMRRTLVIAEVALALVLLTSAGLLLRSTQHLFAVAPGFEPSHLLTMQVDAAGHRYSADSSRYPFFVQARDAVLRVPGVTAAAFTSQLPLSGDFDNYGTQFEGRVGTIAENDPAAFRYTVTPGYLEAMHIPLRHGRFIDARDQRGAPEAILINESYARQIFGDGDPVGRRMRIGPDIGNADRPWGAIVGVVGDVKQASLASDPRPAFYVAMGQWSWVDNVQSLVVQTSVDPATLAAAVRQAVWSVDKVPITRVATMDALITASEAQRHFALIVFEAFALAALALAAIGIYGILSGSVTERMREIGVRSALGASRGDILGLVVRQGMVLTAVGMAIGVAGAAAASGAVSSLLFGVSRLDPVTYLGVIALLGGVSALACSVPAWRAARVDPAITLRAE